MILPFPNNPNTPNFYRVGDDLYRGAQPTATGFKFLEMMGVKSVINLRSFHTDFFKLVYATAGLRSFRIPMKAWHPEREDVDKFLKIVGDERNLPAFIHCQHGADRTGTLCAIYRYKVMGWTKEAAIEEMVKGPFGFHQIWEGILPPFIKNL